MTHANGRWPPRHPDEDELVRAVDASSALRQLLAAASAPPSTAELKGRSRAIADFRAAQRPSAPAPAPEPDTEPTGQARGGRLTAAGLMRPSRWSARVTVACAALVTLLGGTAATAAAGELPTALRNAVSNLFTDPASPGDIPPGGTSSEHPLQPRPGRTVPSSAGASSAGSPASKSSIDSSGGPVERRLAGPTGPQPAGSCRSCRVNQPSRTPAGRHTTHPQGAPLATVSSALPGRPAAGFAPASGPKAAHPVATAEQQESRSRHG
jgi:hypothetical protein